FLARAADPEMAQPGLAHLDHALFQGASANHDAIDLEATIGRERLVATEDFLQGQRGQTVVLETFAPVRHARSLRKTGRGRITVPGLETIRVPRTGLLFPVGPRRGEEGWSDRALIRERTGSTPILGSHPPGAKPTKKTIRSPSANPPLIPGRLVCAKAPCPPFESATQEKVSSVIG